MAGFIATQGSENHRVHRHFYDMLNIIESPIMLEMR